MKKNNKLALGLIFCLFFLWAISSNLLPTMIRQLMKTCELNTFEASFTESAYWLAYFICPIPIAMFMRRYSYRMGIITGLLIAALGGLNAPSDFNWQEAMDRLATLPRQAEWEAFVARFQGYSANARSDEKWQPMERIFHLYK